MILKSSFDWWSLNDIYAIFYNIINLNFKFIKLHFYLLILKIKTEDKLNQDNHSLTS